MDHPSEPLETKVSGEECATGSVAMIAPFLKQAEETLEEVQKMPPPNFNNHQCEYLADKLQVVVKSARSFSEIRLGKCHHGSGSSEDMARIVEISKLLLALAKEIESFIQACCKDGWIQAAMTLTNVSEYVSSLGFNLELCRVALNCKECAASGVLTLDQVTDMHKDEVEVVKSKASVDWDTLVAKVIHHLTDKNALSTEENDLAGYLLQRLHRIKPIPHSASSGLSYWSSIVGDGGSVLGNLYKWVKPLERLGKGATGTVHRALWLGTPVAKKTFSGKDNADFKREVEILGGLCHPNVTSMFCCAEHMHSCSIIMELMDEDLHELMERRCEQRYDGTGDQCPPFTILEAVDIMLQVGEGVNYLHNQVTPSIVHRDLKSSNVLVKRVSGMELESGYVHAKVTDFGLSKTKDCSKRYSQQTFNTGTTRWMAPEVIKLNRQNEASTSKDEIYEPRYPHKCDVYSFGMVCFEILTGHEPFPNELHAIIKDKVLKGERPDLPDYCPLELKVLVKECWNKDPKKRPSFDNICLKLKYLKYLLMTGFNSIGCSKFQFHQEEEERQEYLFPSLKHQGLSFPTSQDEECFHLTRSCSLVLHLGDITKWYKDGMTDAIVNSTNEHMSVGGGVDRAIHRAAGQCLSDACIKVPEVSIGIRCPTGSAVITPGFNLPVSHVIHTVGPIYYDEEDPASLLAMAYKNSVNLAEKNGMKYIAFPAISCGFYGYPLDDASEISIQVLQESVGQLLEIHFVLFEEDTYTAWVQQAEKKLERFSKLIQPIASRIKTDL